MKLIITDIEDFNITINGKYKIIKPQEKINHCIGWLKHQDNV